MAENRAPESPVKQALAILFNRSPRHMEILKGIEQPLPKYGLADSIENRLSQVFVGYSDVSSDRITQYRDFDKMDLESIECQTALDIYAEEAAQPDSKTNMKIWVTSNDQKKADELNGMFQRMNLEAKAYGIYRNIAKYGDCFLYLLLGGYGVHDAYFIHPSRVERVQDDGLLGFKSMDLSTIVQVDNKSALFKPWDMVHLRLMAYDRENVYGRSILTSLRKVWKQYSMLLTMVVLYRIAKSVQRNIFYVDVGQASGAETTQILKEYEKFLKNKTSFVDPRTKEFRLDFNPATMLQDIVWPTRTNSPSKVEYLQNTNQMGTLDDLEKFRNSIISGLGIPKAYFDGDLGGGLFNAREALQLQDVRFSRKVRKLQDAMRDGIVRICQIHWAITHGEYLDAKEIQVNMGTISDNADRMREDIIIRKGQGLMLLAAVSEAMGWNKQVWSDYLLDQIFPLPPELRDKLFTPDPTTLLASQEGIHTIKNIQASGVDPDAVAGLIGGSPKGKAGSYVSKRGQGSFMSPGGKLASAGGGMKEEQEEEIFIPPTMQPLTETELKDIKASSERIKARLKEVAGPAKTEWKDKVKWDELFEMSYPAELKENDYVE